MIGLERIWNEWRQPHKSKFNDWYKKAIVYDNKYHYITPYMMLVLDKNLGDYEEAAAVKKDKKMIDALNDQLKENHYQVARVKDIVSEAKKELYTISKKMIKYYYKINEHEYQRTFDIRLADMIDRVLGNANICLLGKAETRMILLCGDRGYAFLMPVTNPAGGYDFTGSTIQVV